MVLPVIKKRENDVELFLQRLRKQAEAPLEEVETSAMSIPHAPRRNRPMPMDDLDYDDEKAPSSGHSSNDIGSNASSGNLPNPASQSKTNSYLKPGIPNSRSFENNPSSGDSNNLLPIPIMPPRKRMVRKNSDEFPEI